MCLCQRPNEEQGTSHACCYICSLIFAILLAVLSCQNIHDLSKLILATNCVVGSTALGSIDSGTDPPIVLETPIISFVLFGGQGNSKLLFPV